MEIARAQSKGLEARATPVSDTQPIPESVKVRDDLWNKAAAYTGDA